MNIIVFPEIDEINEILNSRSAKNSFADNKAMLFSNVIGGMRFRIALVQSDCNTEIHTARFIASSTEQGLKECFTPINKRRQ